MQYARIILSARERWLVCDWGASERPHPSDENKNVAGWGTQGEKEWQR